VTDPTVTVGVPVRNGSRYLKYALKALLSQTRPIDRIVVSDNASTDDSLAIAIAIANSHPAVEIRSKSENVGGAKNFNDLAILSHSKYFAWAAHDDIWDPELLKEAIAALEGESDIAVAFGKPMPIDENGAPTDDHPEVIWSDSKSARVRVRELLADDIHTLLRDCNPVMGIIRSRLLKQTSLLQTFPSADKALIFELALRGRLHQLDGARFRHRYHADSSVAANPDTRSRQHWFDPYKTNEPTPELSLTAAYLRSVRRSKLPMVDRIAITASVLRWSLRGRRPRRIAGECRRRLMTTVAPLRRSAEC